jgi:hypothetical protein
MPRLLLSAQQKAMKPGPLSDAARPKIAERRWAMIPYSKKLNCN